MSSFSSFLLVPGSWADPLVNATSFPFILVFPSHSSPTCPFLLVRGGYSSCQSSHQSGWEKLDSMVWVWVCQALGSTLRCWQPSPSYCSCTKSVLFFRRFCEMFGRKVVLGHILGPSRSFYFVSLTVGLLGLGFGPLILSGLGLQISGTTIYILNKFKFYFIFKFSIKILAYHIF